MIAMVRPQRKTALGAAFDQAVFRQVEHASAQPESWRTTATALLDCPLDPADRIFVAKVLGWKKLGRDAEHRLAKLALGYFND